MAASARPKPSGAVPEKHGATDVKSSEASSPPEDASKIALGHEDTPAKEAEASLDEQDLKDLEQESGKIPYSRFKEKNDEAKRLREELDATRRTISQEIRRAEELAEIRAAQRLRQEREIAEADSSLDPAERNVRRLEQQVQALTKQVQSAEISTEERFLAEQVGRLEKKYSKKIVLAALGIKRHDPRMNLEEVCEDLESEISDRAQAKLSEVIEKKKARQRSSVPTREGGIQLTEKPKTLAEAKAAVKKLGSFWNR